MTSPTRRLVTCFRRMSARSFVIATVLAIAIAPVGGCQAQSNPLPKAAMVVLDSMREAHESRYVASDSGLSVARELCLFTRISETLGTDIAERLSKEAQKVDAQHTPEEVAKMRSRLVGAYEAPTVEACRRTDSLWYARGATSGGRRP